MPTKLFDVVHALVDEELSLYKSLSALVDSEEETVLMSDMEGLLDVLSRKQSIISRQEILLERWNDISSELGFSEGREGPAFWNAISSRIGESGYNQIVRKIDEIRELGQTLLDRERVIRQKLEENLAEMRKRLMGMERRKNAMRGYSQGISVS